MSLAVKPRPTRRAAPKFSRLIVAAALLPTLLWCPAQAAGSYRVQSGDNLTVIARRYGLTVAQLRAANPQLGNPSALRASATLHLPDAHKPATSHRVRSGENLSGIAAQYHLSLGQLIRANSGLSASKLVQIGKLLYIPARRVVTAAKVKSAPARAHRSGAVVRAASVRPPSGSSWLWPVQGWISSGFGERSLDGDSEMHYGLDIVVPENTAVRAARAGKVIESRADFARGWGWTIIVDHGDGWKTRYAHLSRNLARVGDTVVRGQIIARSGNSGRSTGPHLHYGTYLWDVPKNPLSLMD
ncbi:peptidase M23 [Deinococcus irradiatisoli]|uniref:Peptidase M23 n=1 Tax=Deinococcus irradiatisoli TaxID=2202254 RepID=A0A2Z3J9U8_9DEIO|nr:M23 family metallopeptidase [Deinococcus irradiatisoli]AWN21853.1 peptidase M23 [Deinococcus irradiatisoli]